MPMVVADLPVGLPLRPGDQLDGRLRHRAGRLVVQQQVRPAGRAPGQRPDGLLRGGDGAEPHPGAAACPATSSFSTIIEQQQAGLWYVLPLFSPSSSSSSRASPRPTGCPFDLPEAESELIAGYHTEYSAMKFSFFFIAEYANVVTVCAMVTTLFFGGWDIPFTDWDRAGDRARRRWRPGRSFFLKVLVLDLLRHVDPVDPAALPLRPAHGAGLEGPDAAGAGLHHGDLRRPSTCIERVLGITEPRLSGARPVRRQPGVAVLVFGLLDSGVFIKGSGRRARHRSEARAERARVAG